MAVVDRIEKLPNVRISTIQPPFISIVVARGPPTPGGRRSSRPEAVRAVQEVLLVDRFQHHDDRPLKDLVLEGRDPEGPGLRPEPFGDVHPPHRRCPVRAGLGPVQQRLEVAPQVLCVVLAVCPSTPRPRPCACAGTPRAASRCRCGGPRRESHLGDCLRQLRYPLLFRGHVHGFDAPAMFPSNGLMTRRPLPSAGSLGMVPPPPRYYETLRLPAARPAALRCLRLAVSRSHPRFAPVAAGCAGHGPGVGHPVPPAGTCRGDDRVSQVPGEPSCPCPVLRPRRDRVRQAIAAPRRGLRSVNNDGSRDMNHFGAQSHGSLTRCLRFAARVTPAPRKTRFRLLARLCRAGIGYPQGSNERFPRYDRFLVG